MGLQSSVCFCSPSLHFSLHTFRVLGLKKCVTLQHTFWPPWVETLPQHLTQLKILSSVGIEAESDKLEKVIAELSGKDLKTLIAEGHTKLASMPAGGSAAPAAGGAPAAAAAAPAEAKKEEKKEESEEEDDDMGFGLFD